MTQADTPGRCLLSPKFVEFQKADFLQRIIESEASPGSQCCGLKQGRDRMVWQFYFLPLPETSACKNDL